MEEITDEEYLAILESNVQEAKKELSAAQKEYDIVIEVVLIEEAKMRSEQFSLTAIGEPIPDEMEKRHAVQYADNSALVAPVFKALQTATMKASFARIELLRVNREQMQSQQNASDSE